MVYFPKHLKTARIYPIYETGAKEDPSNYRPISILPTDQVTNLSQNNKMPINYNKTTIMTLGSRHNICK